MKWKVNWNESGLVFLRIDENSIIHTFGIYWIILHGFY